VRSPPRQPDAPPPEGPDGRDDGVQRRRVYLQGGEIFASAEPAEVSTVLGSCVGVCLFAPAARVGGLNHFLLPTGPDARSARFGDAAMRLLLEEVLARGARRHELRAKIFGGAAVLGGEARAAPTVGAQNVALAIQALGAAGIPTFDGDVGGTRGRKLVFHTDTGDVWVKTL
jgi:chemotaxis protein CheD